MSLSLPTSYARPVPLRSRSGSTSKSIDQAQTIVVDEFNSSYWSGIDVTIFFEDYYIDDIVNIQYQISEQVYPIYSYGGYKYSHMGRGSRIVQGTFSINFKRSLYIPNLLKQIKQDRETSILPGSISRTTSNIKQKLLSPQTIDQILGMAKANNGNLNRNVLDDIAAANREKFWNTTTNIDYVPTNKPLFSAGQTGFTIFIKYGNPQILDGRNPILSSNGLALPAKDIGTIEALEDVHITGVAKAIDDSGKSILEIYSWSSKDLVSEDGQIIR